MITIISKELNEMPEALKAKAKEAASRLGFKPNEKVYFTLGSNNHVYGISESRITKKEREMTETRKPIF